MLHRFSFFLVAGLLATPAIGDECPTAETAKHGFVLERAGTRAEIRPSANHFVHVINFYPGGKKQDVIYYRGLFPISRFDNSARSINVPVSDIRSVFPLDLKSRRALTYASNEPDRIGTLISLELTVSGEEMIRLGSCSYRSLLVRTRSLNAEGKVLSEYTDLYSPELGFTLAKRYDEKSGKPFTVKYDTIRPLDRNSRH